MFHNILGGSKRVACPTLSGGIVAGNGFIGRLTNDQLVLTKSGSGDISNNTAICDNVSRIISIMEGSVVIGSDSEGVNIKITSGKGTSRVYQGSGNGVVNGFSGKGKTN
mgnify:CR=1 FL=1